MVVHFWNFGRVVFLVILLGSTVIKQVSSFCPSWRSVCSHRATLPSVWRKHAFYAASSSTPDTKVSPPPPDYLARYNTTVSFPPYPELMTLAIGECAVSQTLTVTTDDESFDFCVKMYPRGGGHASKHTVLQRPRQTGWFGRDEMEKVALYLQFFPRTNETVDATFGLQLVGQQQTGPRFNVEWRAGMRFVPLQDSKLSQGRANDFGAHFLQTNMLADFLGDSQDPVQVKVEIIIHGPPPRPTSESSIPSSSAMQEENESMFSSGFGLLPLADIRHHDIGDDETMHNPKKVRVGRIVVPILQKLPQRPRLMALGAYPGVEYRILRIIDPQTETDLFYSRPGVDYELKPIYPLVPALERPWPVRVNEKDLPKLYTANMYNAISAIGSLLTAVLGLLLAFVVSQAVSLFVIPSRSMEPTLQVGDVLLVDKVTPRLFNTKNFSPGQVVLFQPPNQLRDIVSQSGGRLTDRDLFVKRIAATEDATFAVVDSKGQVQIDGMAPAERRDLCTVEPLGLIQKYIRTYQVRLEPGQVAVLGDCSSVSIDSRVWGPLPTQNIVGRPIVRLWPLSRFGPVQPLTTDWSE